MCNLELNFNTRVITFKNRIRKQKLVLVWVQQCLELVGLSELEHHEVVGLVLFRSAV